MKEGLLPVSVTSYYFLCLPSRSRPLFQHQHFLHSHLHRHLHLHPPTRIRHQKLLRSRAVDDRKAVKRNVVVGFPPLRRALSLSRDTALLC